MSDQDEPMYLSIGPITDIPIVEDDDPRLARNRHACALVDLMVTTDLMLAGVRHDDWYVQLNAIPRLAVRESADPRTVPALLELLAGDPHPEIRGTAAHALMRFADAPGVHEALKEAELDPDADVRWSVGFALRQMYHSDE